MASIPSLAAPNYRANQPSAIETSLASQVDNPQNPSAFPLLMMYRSQNQRAGEEYQQSMQGLQAQQAVQAQQAAQQAQIKGYQTSLKDFTSPGQIDYATQLGLFPKNLDQTGLLSDARASTDAVNFSKGGDGIAKAAMAGFTGLAPAASRVFGDPVGQGQSAIEKVANIKGATSRATAGASGGKVRIAVPLGALGPNQASASISVPADQADTALGQLQSMSNREKQRTTEAGKLSAAKTAVANKLPVLAHLDPNSYKDIVAGSKNGAPTIVASPTDPADTNVVGASGTRYSVNRITKLQ